MINATAYRDKRVAVFGLARSGLATARSLAAGGAQVLAWDDNAAALKEAVATTPGIHIENLYDIDFSGPAGVDALVVSPGVPLHAPVPHPLVRKAQRAGVGIIGDLQVFQSARDQLPSHAVVAITGTNGKSTTTALLSHILRETGVPAAEGGNIGTPVLGLEPLPTGGIYVFEMSSYQIDLCHDFAAEIAILLNITPDHLDRHGDMEGYVAAKKRLFDMQGDDGIAIIGVDDAPSRMIAATANGRVVPISAEGPVDNGIFWQGGKLYDALDGAGKIAVDLSDISSLQGGHNGQNAAAAYAAARLMGRSVEQIASAMGTFTGLPHRMQLVDHLRGAAFINDSKATNTVAAAKALEACHDIHWIAGGIFKEDTMEALAPGLSHVKQAYLIGDSAERFAAYLEGKCAAKISGTLQGAVRDAYDHVQPGETVLLSPACASFDQFKSFEHRGSVFVDVVRDLKGSDVKINEHKGAAL